MSSTDNEKLEHRRDWFAVERRVFDDDMFAGDEFSRRDAWLWLIANAAKRDHHARTRAGVIELKRGEVIVARDYVAAVWGWTPKRVRTFLEQLSVAGRIELGQSKGHFPTVAKISKYGLFQSSDQNTGPVKGQVEGQSRASGGPHPYKEHYTKDKGRGDDDAITKPDKPKRVNGSLTAGERAEAEGAIADYNTAAATLGFSRCATSDARSAAVAKRLAEIGKGDVFAGRDRWHEALQAIGHWPFLAGREKPKPGKTPFKLDLERLLSTGSGMGDVLAKLLDLYAEHGPARATDHQAARPAISSAWAEAQAEELAAQRARWAPTPTHGGTDAVL